MTLKNDFDKYRHWYGIASEHLTNTYRKIREPISNDIFLRFYGENTRYYHNLDHIAGICQVHFTHMCNIEAVRTYFGETDAEAWSKFVVALFFHDLIYDARRNDNELTSAMLYASMQGEKDDEIYKAIMATIHDGKAKDTAPWIQWLLDLDLYGLGLPWKEFRANTDLIRKEFIHVPDRKWMEGRIKWIDTMLARQHIYYDPFKLIDAREHETAARLNLVNEREEFEKALNHGPSSDGIPVLYPRGQGT